VKNKTILVVDDDKAILKTFKVILEKEGYCVDTAETGAEALKKSKEAFFNLALLDIRLPDMEGTRLLSDMQRSVPRMMKIMITGHASLENAVASLNLGADAYLMKPVSPEELLKVVERTLKEQEEEEEVTQKKVTKWIETRVKQLEGEG